MGRGINQHKESINFTAMDSSKVAKTFKGMVYESRDNYLLQPVDPSKAHESIQGFVDRMLKEYDGQKVVVKVVVKVAIDIDVE